MTTGCKSAILKDVVAYVDVWSSSKTENYSKPFIQQLQEMGAEVAKTLNKQVTHVVFKNGRHATWNKAKKMGVRLVSVLWVARCKDDGEHVDEELWPALNEEINPAIKNKAHRCMQPKDTPERTPENDRRMKKKLDKMIKDIVPKSPLITDVSPYIIDEVNGIVYSPSLKRADYMAQRLKDMKEKRENLSPTASQMRECRSSPRLRSSPRSTPPGSILHLLDEDSEDDFSSPIGAHLPSSDKRDTAFQCEESDNNQGVKDIFDKPWLSPCGHVSRPKPSFHIINSDLQEDKKGTTSGKISKGILVKRDEVSLDAGNGPDSSMNDQLETKSVSPTIIKWGPSSRKSKMTKSKKEKTGSLTQSKTNADLKFLNTRSCSLSATLIESAHAPKQVSEETCLPSLIVNKQTNEPSAPARSSTVSNEPASLTSRATTDENDDVFKDYFSPANDHFRQRSAVLPSSFSKSTMQVPFDLEPNPGKRRRKTSQTPEPESGYAKRKKHEEMHNVAHISQDSISVNSISDPQVKPVGRKRSRLVTMPVTSCSHLPAETAMRPSPSAINGESADRSAPIKDEHDLTR